jgi:hypothetical protein
MVVAERNFFALSASLLIDVMADSILEMILVDKEAAKSSSAKSSIRKATAIGDCVFDFSRNFGIDGQGKEYVS